MVNRRSSTRGSIVHLLKQNGELTAGEIAVLVGVTPVAIRHHLDDLLSEGQVETRRVPIPRGRPRIAYRLRQPAGLLPTSCGNLAAQLLEELVAIDGESKITRLIEARADRLSRDYESRLAGVEGLPDRLRELARLRDGDGYQTVLDVRDGDLVLREENCPLRGFADKYPEACACEERLLQKLLSKGLRRSGSATDAESPCEYRIDDPAKDVPA